MSGRRMRGCVPAAEGGNLHPAEGGIHPAWSVARCSDASECEAGTVPRCTCILARFHPQMYPGASTVHAAAHFDGRCFARRANMTRKSHDPRSRSRF